MKSILLLLTGKVLVGREGTEITSVILMRTPVDVNLMCTCADCNCFNDGCVYGH